MLIIYDNAFLKGTLLVFVLFGLSFKNFSIMKYIENFYKKNLTWAKSAADRVFSTIIIQKINKLDIYKH